jgi:hypothetical protein
MMMLKLNSAGRDYVLKELKLVVFKLLGSTQEKFRSVPWSVFMSAALLVHWRLGPSRLSIVFPA